MKKRWRWRGWVIAIAIAIAGADARADADAKADADANANANANAGAKAEGSEDTDPAALFRGATEALAAERAGEAIAKLEALGDRGMVDAVVSYDRGLAYAARVRGGAEQAGDLGRAAHGFEEARELSRDRKLVADATAALDAVRGEVARRRSRAGDPVELEQGTSLGRSIVKLLPENVWAVIAALCSLALAVGIVIRARAQVKRLRVAGTTTGAIAGGLLLLVTLVLHSARDIRLHVREAVVIAPSTRLLDDHHVALVAVGPLPEGVRVELLDEGADFMRVSAGHAVGWLPAGTVLPMAK